MTEFPDLNVDEVYNASGIVPIADSRFLICDNNTNDALLELTIAPDGRQQGPLVRRPLGGIAEDIVDDMEDLAYVDAPGGRIFFATTSVSMKAGSKKKKKKDDDEGGKKKKKEEKPATPRPGGILRIRTNAAGGLDAEPMPEFRDWLVANVPEIGAAANVDPDSGGLNIEGLVWDDSRGALLLGVRTPVPGGQPMVVPVRVKDIAGPWTPENLEALPTIRLQVEQARDEQGVRGMAVNTLTGGGFLVMVGNSTSESKAPFALYHWDGGNDGTMRRIPVAFAKKAKPEGVTTGTVGGRAAILFADDAGGFAVLWADAVGL